MRVAIVGAGFSGLAAALELSEVSEVTIFEEHGEVGIPEHCTGIVSKRVYEALKFAEEAVEGKLEEYFIGTKEGKGIRIKGPKGFTVKFQRKRLEEIMLEVALSKGAKFINKFVREVSPKGRVDGETFDRVIVAEGWGAEIAKSLHVAPKPRRVYGINLEVKGKTAFPGTVEVWFDEALAPGFFAWVVMLEGKAVVGTASEPKRGNVRKLAEKVLEQAVKRGLVEGEVVKVYGGVIQTGPPSLAPYRGKVAVTGDAAGLNKPLTGGGLYPSLEVAKGYRKYFPRLWRAYHPLVERLYAETYFSRLLHKGNQKFYDKLFNGLDGFEIYLEEYDNHVKALFSAVKALGLRGVLKALASLPYALHPL